MARSHDCHCGVFVRAGLAAEHCGVSTYTFRKLRRLGYVREHFPDPDSSEPLFKRDELDAVDLKVGAS